jgi:hypothetical protein
MLLGILVALITFGPIHGAEESKNFSSTATTTATSTEPFIATTTPEVKKVVRQEDVSEWKYPQLRRICSCESTGSPNNEPRQFDNNGNVLLGKVNNLDVGQCQINLKYHGDAAESLGMNLFTKAGNKAYAEYLYENQGSTPWNWSKACWGK